MIHRRYCCLSSLITSISLSINTTNLWYPREFFYLIIKVQYMQPLALNLIFLAIKMLSLSSQDIYAGCYEKNGTGVNAQIFRIRDILA